MGSLRLIPKINYSLNIRCESCTLAKQLRKCFKAILFEDTHLLELIHNEVANFNKEHSRGGSEYLLTFIYNHSKYCHTCLLKFKDEVLFKFKIYKAKFEN